MLYYAKAVVPLLVASALTVLGVFGVTGDMTVDTALTLGITSILVYLVPNKK